MTFADPVVLVADDSNYDALLMQTVFQRAGWVRPLLFVQDGEQAISYLGGEGAHADRARFPLPSLLLLDLNMPRKNGFEALAWIRQQPRLQGLHVYILSASSQPEDIQRSYDLGATSYLVKPSNLDGLMHLARTLLGWVRLSHFASCGS